MLSAKLCCKTVLIGFKDDLLTSVRGLEFELSNKEQSVSQRSATTNAMDGFWKRRQSVPAVPPIATFRSRLQYLADG